MVTEIGDLTPKEYELFRKLVYGKSGINLGDNKMALVRARLAKRLRALGIEKFTDYYTLVEQDTSGHELSLLLDAISTNTTYLFREIEHFRFLRNLMRAGTSDPAWRQRHGTIRVWSAACSSGDEPYSIAMVMDDALASCRDLNWKILATDISTKMLAQASAGTFSGERVGHVPPAYKQRYLRRRFDKDGEAHDVAPALKDHIRFARFNLMTPNFPFRNPFDVIFCRNVMIYFDKPTQAGLIHRFARHLRPGGYLLIGHSESLSGMNQPLTYVQPTIYKRT